MREVHRRARGVRTRALLVASVGLSGVLAVTAPWSPVPVAGAAGGAQFGSSVPFGLVKLGSFGGGINETSDGFVADGNNVSGSVELIENGFSGTVTVDHDVDISGTTFTVTTTASWVGGIPNGDPEAFVETAFAMDVGFTVSTAAEYSLTVEWNDCGGVRLENLMTNEFLVDDQPAVPCVGGGGDVQTRGVLGPADYNLSVGGTDGMSSGFGAVSGSITSTFVVEGSACTIIGTNGPDVLNGTAGDDVMCGLAGDDTINAGGGHDVVFGGLGNDTIDGGSGNDALLGQENNDVLRGGIGDDRLFGGSGNDTISGDDGADLAVGGLGADTITGGASVDVIAGCAQDDTIDGGAGNDQIRGGYPVAGDAALLSGGSPARDLVALGAELADSGCNSRPTNDGRDRIVGGAGDDVIESGTEADLVIGGVGDDTIRPGAGDDLVSAGDGDDLITDDAGRDRLAGCGGSDTVIGGRDNDILSGGRPLPGFFPATGTVVLGTDAKVCSTDTVGARNRVDGGAGDDEVDGDQKSKDRLIGGPGNDVLNGLGGADSLDGGDGDDTLRPGSGADTAKGGTGNDVFFTKDSTRDVVDGGAGRDTATVDRPLDAVRGVERIRT
jgi:Ca2+-binding RTX toxin-like protein